MGRDINAIFGYGIVCNTYNCDSGVLEALEEFCKSKNLTLQISGFENDDDDMFIGFVVAADQNAGQINYSYNKFPSIYDNRFEIKLTEEQKAELNKCIEVFSNKIKMDRYKWRTFSYYS